MHYFKKMAMVAATVGVMSGVLPGVPAMAAPAKDVKVPSSGETTQEVETYFNVTEEDLNELGYDLVVTVPVSFELGFDSASRSYTGSGKVSASGVVDSGKAVHVKIDQSHEKYGKIFDSESTADVTAVDTTGFEASMTQEKWTKEMCYRNLQDKISSSDLSWKSDLSVTVPFSAFTLKNLGKYTTTVPLVISLVDEA